jgi:hypothetical protein
VTNFKNSCDFRYQDNQQNNGQYTEGQLAAQHQQQYGVAGAKGVQVPQPPRHFAHPQQQPQMIIVHAGSGPGYGHHHRLDHVRPDIRNHQEFGPHSNRPASRADQHLMEDMRSRSPFYE